MSAKHTPGPWEAGSGQFASVKEIRPAKLAKGWTSGYAPIARIIGDKRITDEKTNEANARLIAAAPELLEALILIFPMIERMKFEAEASYGKNFSQPNTDAARKYYCAIRSAIAKATGQS